MPSRIELERLAVAPIPTDIRMRFTLANIDHAQANEEVVTGYFKGVRWCTVQWVVRQLELRMSHEEIVQHLNLKDPSNISHMKAGGSIAGKHWPVLLHKFGDLCGRVPFDLTAAHGFREGLQAMAKLAGRRDSPELVDAAYVLALLGHPEWDAAVADPGSERALQLATAIDRGVNELLGRAFTPAPRQRLVVKINGVRQRWGELGVLTLHLLQFHLRCEENP